MYVCMYVCMYIYIYIYIYIYYSYRSLITGLIFCCNPQKKWKEID